MGRRLLQLLQSRLHRPALRMPERDDVARDADHKEIAKSLIEDDLHGHPAADIIPAKKAPIHSHGKSARRDCGWDRRCGRDGDNAGSAKK